MRETERKAERYAKDKSSFGSDFHDCKKSFEYGADYMLARILDFMMNFQDGNGEFPLYNYVGNVRTAMEE